MAADRATAQFRTASLRCSRRLVEFGGGGGRSGDVSTAEMDGAYRGGLYASTTRRRFSGTAYPCCYHLSS